LSVPPHNQGRICVSVAAETVAEAIGMAQGSGGAADVTEIRLYTLSRPEIRPFVEQLKGPLLFTNRAEWEGGFFQGTEAERVGLLLEAVQHDCALVDLELRAAPELRGELLDRLAQHPRTRLIISWHDFEGTPASETLGEILQEQAESGAHVGKIVTTAREPQDVIRVLQLLGAAAESGFPLIAFCMGAIGRISRLATVTLGGYMTYGAPQGGSETAAGQMPVAVLRDMLAQLTE
jgi:3-dehydroquinate dehydratase type I